MTANYECTVIVRQDVSTTQAEQVGKDVETLITENGGSVVRQESWGLRSFAYRIRKNRKGHYLYYEVQLPATAVQEVDRRLKLFDDVLRHLLVKVEEFSGEDSAMLQSRYRDERSDAA